MTTFKYEYYNELAENKTYKKLAIEAPRGEIKIDMEDCWQEIKTYLLFKFQVTILIKRCK